MRTVIIDAFDSFVYVIDQYLQGAGASPEVLRSHPNNLDVLRRNPPDAIVLGPGPGHPDESGHVELVREFAGEVPILGVCLGHQAIGRAFGAEVHPASHVMHGKTSLLDHDGRGMFSSAAPHPVVTRYHSLVIEESSLPTELVVSARSQDDGLVMGVRHRELPVESVQFHPESILTEAGFELFRSFFRTHVAAWEA